MKKEGVLYFAIAYCARIRHKQHAYSASLRARFCKFTCVPIETRTKRSGVSVQFNDSFPCPRTKRSGVSVQFNDSFPCPRTRRSGVSVPLVSIFDNIHQKSITRKPPCYQKITATPPTKSTTYDAQSIVINKETLYP